MSSTFFRSNHTILGGSIDNTPIGVTDPDVGFFTNLDVDGIANLDQVNIDTTDGAFSVTGSNPFSMSTVGNASISTTSGDLAIGAAANLDLTTTTGTMDLTSFGDINIEATDAASVVNINTTPVVVSDTTGSTSPSTGALTVSGGVGIAENLYVGGNQVIGGDLTVQGTTTTIESETVIIEDNIILVNSGPSTTKDGGYLVQRWQTENNAGTGDVVDGPTFATGTATGGSANTITFPVTFTTGGASSVVDDTYNGWWVRVTNDSPAGILGEVRQITDYDGATRVATVNTAWDAGSPTALTEFSLHACNFVGTIWDEGANELSFICTDESSADFVDIIEYLNVHVGDITIDGDVIGSPTFSSVYSLDFDTPPPVGTGPLEIGSTNANLIQIGRTGVTTEIVDTLQVDGDVLPQVSGTLDLGSAALRFGDIWFSGTVSGGGFSTQNVLPTLDNTYDLGSAALSYRNVHADGTVFSGAFDTTGVAAPISIGGTNAGTVSLGRTGQLTTVLGDFSVAGGFAFGATLAYSCELLTVAPSGNVNPTLGAIVSRVNVSGAPSSDATGTMPAGTVDCQVKMIVAVGAADGYTLTFGSQLYDACGTNTGTMRLRFSTVGQSAVLLWRTATTAWYIAGGSGAEVLTV